MDILRLPELLDRAVLPGAAPEFSALGRQPALVLAADEQAFAARSPEERRRVLTWLRQQVCPILAVSSARQAAGPLTAAADAVVATTQELQPLLDTITRAPRAASLLVQVLRVTPQVAVDQGLLVESLAYATLQSGPEYRDWLATHTRIPALPEAGPPVLLERQGATLTLLLNRAGRRNAMSVEVRDALVAALQLVVSDPGIERVRLGGLGACFSVGGDLDEFGTAPDAVTGHLVRRLQLPARWLAACAERVECQVHSACIGAGIELPAFAGRLVARRNAFFQLPELRYGLIPGAGGCVSLPRRIGAQRTAWLALSGRRLPAATALEWGLVDEIID